eukprot:SAG31_NODE_12616_length_929_cov_0.949398_2_plen_157_part_00
MQCIEKQNPRCTLSSETRSSPMHKWTLFPAFMNAGSLGRWCTHLSNFWFALWFRRENQFGSRVSRRVSIYQLGSKDIHEPTCDGSISINNIASRMHTKATLAWGTSGQARSSNHLFSVSVTFPLFGHTVVLQTNNQVNYDHCILQWHTTKPVWLHI